MVPMQIIALEGSNMNMQTFNAMRSGAKAMQDARGRLDVDQVDDVMDDIKDEMDIAEQVGTASVLGPRFPRPVSHRLSFRCTPQSLGWGIHAATRVLFACWTSHYGTSLGRHLGARVDDHAYLTKSLARSPHCQAGIAATATGVSRWTVVPPPKPDGPLHYRGSVMDAAHLPMGFCDRAPQGSGDLDLEEAIAKPALLVQSMRALAQARSGAVTHGTVTDE